ncbi:DNA-binding protein [Pseudomonas sp. SG20056]|uniref:DNA-binding protein n=1 Tax=Pseudomonas sp. SG20056 TaxID=3074146 RepID=UPI00287FA75F|nr:DNA-binding protein [Pseudomonas sp. SG20056]WNF48419.1 DNA-binding protein [Pseudomonas sp. SG20056]
MNGEGINLTLKDLLAPPPVMPWREFANWIRMTEDHDTVWGWIRNGYIPSHKVGKHVMVNVALFTQYLMEKEFQG